MNLSFILRYIRYYISSHTRHDVHSPFIYSLVEIITKKENKPVFDKIEKLRDSLEKDTSLISDQDYGAGGEKVQTVAAIAKSSSKPEKYARLLHRIVQHYKPGYLIEMGTCFGISALYQASGNTSGKLITLEGNGSRAIIAEKIIRESGLKNVEVVKGQFETTLPLVLDHLPRLDYVFIDGNHRLNPTLSYFEQCLNKSHNETVFIFDDINWSMEMQEAWAIIKSHPKTRVTVDLFMLGIVFLNPELSKQDFVIRY